MHMCQRVKGHSMTDCPERISISPVHRPKQDDDFYLVDRDAYPDKGTEYIRLDLHEAEVKRLREALVALVDELCI